MNPYPYNIDTLVHTSSNKKSDMLHAIEYQIWYMPHKSWSKCHINCYICIHLSSQAVISIQITSHVLFLLLHMIPELLIQTNKNNDDNNSYTTYICNINNIIITTLWLEECTHVADTLYMPWNEFLMHLHTILNF